MERIKFTVVVPRAVALAHGSGSYGETVYEPTDEWLAQLSETERTQFSALCGQLRNVADYRGQTNTKLHGLGDSIVPELDAPLSVESVLAAVRRVLAAEEARRVERDAKRAAHAAEERAREAKEAAAREANIVRLLASPYEAFFDNNGNKVFRNRADLPRNDVARFFEWSDSGVDHWNDPRVSAHVAPFLVRASERKAELAAAAEAKKAAAQAAIESAEYECRMWAAEHVLEERPEIARAAREGRRVGDALGDALADRIRQALAGLLVPGQWIPDSFYGHEPRTDVPTPEAYALFDGLTAGIPAITQAATLTGVQVTVGPISRIDVAKKGTLYRTGVVVAVTHPWFVLYGSDGSSTCEWAVLCEPLDEDDDDDNDD